MPSLTLSAPTTAERVRSACVRDRRGDPGRRRCTALPAPVHHLLPDGSFALTVPHRSAAAVAAARADTGGVPAVLELTDYAPLPLREPVRSLVWVRGRLHGVPAGAPATCWT